VAVVYASASRALAVLETFMHLALEARTLRFVLCTIELPPRVRLTRHAVGPPPRSLGESQAVGRRWIEDHGTLALVVPSVMVPQECNYLLNVRHRHFEGLAVSREPFSFDERLWRRA
jgi:RES domain-containing protein